jgi:hypothetical protein
MSSINQQTTNLQEDQLNTTIIDHVDDDYLNLDIPIDHLNENNFQQSQNIPTNQQVISNVKTNYPFGNILENNKPDNHIRLYFKNINGIKNYNSWEIW